MNTANAIVRHLVDGRSFIVDAPLEGDVRITPGVRAFEGGQRPLEDLEAELRVRDDAGGWAW
ncbi:hypothetical protein [Actinomyces naeslundii]|uniref:hypothetical protein n=1 Tax=Actinomyces naeslundii TaxID=1655 RepID=UPI003C6EFBAA